MIFDDCDIRLSTDDINTVEDALGLSLPQVLRDHYIRWNGGSPDPYVYEDDHVDTVVAECLPLRSVRGSGTAPDAYRSLVLGKHIVENRFFPFAIDGSGDYFFVDCSSENGAVYLFRSDSDEPLLSLEVGLVDFWSRLKEEG